MTSAMITEQRIPNFAPALARSNFFCAEILPDKGSEGKRKAGDGQKREALDSGIAAAARHRVVAEGIDIRLHHHVCDGDDGILNARRQPVTQDLSQHILMETYFFDGNSVHFLRAQQLYDAEQRADALRNSRRRRGGSHAPLENADKEQVQNDVEAGGKNQIV